MLNTPPNDPSRDLARSVDALRDTVDAERRAHKRTVRWIVGALTAAAFLTVVSLLVATDNHKQNERLKDQTAQIADQNHRLEDLFEARAKAVVEQCEQTNNARQAIREAFFVYTDALAAYPPATPRTPAEQAAHEARVAEFKAGLAERFTPLASRDCSRPTLGLPEEEAP